MAYLTENQIAALSSPALSGAQLTVSRGNSRQDYTLHESYRHGMKGLVWRGCDDIGQSVAIKFIPAEEYKNRSLIDEMTEVSKLGGQYFAAVKFFGDAETEVHLVDSYKCIVTEWIEGTSVDEFAENETISVSDFISIAEKLFTVLAILRRHGLCHDDLHPGNILIHRLDDPLTYEPVFVIKVIDTGTIKRLETRDLLLGELRHRLGILKAVESSSQELGELQKFLEWKEPDDHFRIVESLLKSANCLVRLYARLDFWERRFIDELKTFFDMVGDEDLERRLDSPDRAVEELWALVRASQRPDDGGSKLGSPFDYISAEMIRNNREFSELFSGECPWLEECKSIEPLYIYGPRGCGKSSVLRWLAFKTIAADPNRDFSDLREIGIYVSCSVELRSRFWLLGTETIERVQALAIRYFSLLLLEELFDTLDHMEASELRGCDFGLKAANRHDFVTWCVNRISLAVEPVRFRLQGQGHFAYLKTVSRRLKWDTWAAIQALQVPTWLPDPSVVSDVCKEISERFDFFKSRHITFLLDDYSNQRIPVNLQRKLNQTISFAKQGNPIFKVSSEYMGVDLEGIQEGREVVEVNVGERYTSLEDDSGAKFLTDMVDIRLRKAGFRATSVDLLGSSGYNGRSMAKAIAEQEGSFYYHGIETVHWLCSGDLALALDVIRKIFESAGIGPSSRIAVVPSDQHAAIQQFSHDEIKRIKYIVPHGDRMFDIVCYLGAIARAFVMDKKSRRRDKFGDPVCKTHMDIRSDAIRALEKEGEKELLEIFDLLVSRAIFISLTTSRSRIAGGTERYQMKRIFFPAFKAPVKRDAPIKVDTMDELKSLLSNPHTFAERECARSKVAKDQLTIALQSSKVKPRE